MWIGGEPQGWKEAQYISKQLNLEEPRNAQHDVKLELLAWLANWK